MGSVRSAPRVFVSEDTRFYRVALSEIVAEAGCEVVLANEGGDVRAEIEAVGPPLSLVMLPLYPDPPRALASVRELRGCEWLREVPILAISPLDQKGLDLAQLRALGVGGLIDKRALPEHVRFRIGQLVHRQVEGRRFERAPCCIPVDVEVDGEVRTEYAISLSVGGMGLACNREIAPNTPVSLRFLLEEQEGELVEAKGRAVHVSPSSRKDAAFEVGVFFYPLPESACRALQAEVSQLLEAWATVSRMDMEKDEPEPC